MKEFNIKNKRIKISITNPFKQDCKLKLLTIWYSNKWHYVCLDILNISIMIDWNNELYVL